MNQHKYFWTSEVLPKLTVIIYLGCFKPTQLSNKHNDIHFLLFYTIDDERAVPGVTNPLINNKIETIQI